MSTSEKGIYWTRITKGDIRGRHLADRHYTRQRPGHPMWTRPGYNFVLYLHTAAGEALWCWWRPKWEDGHERFDGLRAIECTMFRNERTGVLSSILVREAVAALSSPEARADLKLAAPESCLLITGVGSRQTASRRSKRSLPGRCFREAGWVDLPHRKGRADVWLVAPSLAATVPVSLAGVLYRKVE